MSDSDDLLAIIDRIIAHQHSDDDLAVLRQIISTSSSQGKVQIGKHIVNIAEARDIHIGDKIYQGADAAAIRKIIQDLIQDLVPQKVNWRCVANLAERDFTQEKEQSTGIGIIDKLAKKLTNLSQQSVMRYGLKLAFSPNPIQEYFISGGNQIIKRWQINTWEKLQEIPVTDNFDLWFTSVAISPDAQIIAGCKAYHVYIWNLAEVKTIHTLDKTPFSNLFDVLGFDSVAFSPDSKVLAANDNQGIKLWDVETGKEIAKLSGHSDKVTCVAFNPKNARILASCSYDKTIKIWDLDSKICLETLTEHQDAVYTLAFSPDGKIIASGSNDNTIKLWKSDTGEMLKTLRQHSDTVTCLVFSPLDGNTLVSGSNDGKIVEWKINENESQIFPEEHRHRRGVTSIAISPDGKTLISGGRDQTIKVWELNMLKEFPI